MPIHLQLPELEEPPLIAAGLVRYPTRLTLCILALLAAATVVALSWVRIDVAVEAAGTLEGTVESTVGADSATPWRAILWVAQADVDRIQPGNPVKVRIPALVAESGGSGSWLAVVTKILAEPGNEDGSGDGLRVEIEIEIEIEHPELDHPERQANWESLRRGMAVNGRVITHSATAWELLRRTVEGTRLSHGG